MGFDWNAFEDLTSLFEDLRLHKERCLEARICPECGKDVGNGIGTGRLADGIFCSLDCHVNFRVVEARYFTPPGRN
jgi:hypothetical protein